MSYIVLYRKYNGEIIEVFRTGNLAEALESFDRQTEIIRAPSTVSLCIELAQREAQ